MSDLRFWYHLPAKVGVQHTLSCAEKAERVGFDVVSHMDHFLFVSGNMGSIPECWTMLSAAAMRTGLEVVPVVMCSLFRNPALLAKMVATLDQITGGRVHLGIGAGWWREEFEAYGYRWPSAKERVDRTIEATEIIKKLWTEEEVSYGGRFWNIKECVLLPKPHRDPHPPIWNGGAGPRMLRMTGELCDGWISGGKDPDAVKDSIDTVKEAASGREMRYAQVLFVDEGEAGLRDASERIEAFVPIGITDFIFAMRPDAHNIQMLDDYGDLIRRFR